MPVVVLYPDVLDCLKPSTLIALVLDIDQSIPDDIRNPSFHILVDQRIRLQEYLRKTHGVYFETTPADGGLVAMRHGKEYFSPETFIG